MARASFWLAGLATAGFAIVMLVAWSGSMLARFADGLQAKASEYGLVVQSDGWSVSWQRAVVTTTNLTLSSAESSQLLLRAPLVEVDFSRVLLNGGWQDAVYQVYVHQPHVYVSGSMGSTWNWQQPFFGESAIRAARAARMDGSQRFNLGRLYADVVTVHWQHEGSPVVFDNGVLTVTNFCLPYDGRETPTHVAFHARVDGGKFSLEGDGNLFRWQAVSPWRWSPTGEFQIQVDRVGGQAQRALGLNGDATRMITAGR